MEKTLRMSASLWSADLSALGDSITMVDPYCDSYHFDIMDGHFTQDLLFGPDTVRALRRYTDRPFEVHLMVDNPENFIDPFIDAGADTIMFHPETSDDPSRIIKKVKSAGGKVGAAIVSDADILEMEEWIVKSDVVLVMGTKIGIKGVSMFPETFNRIAQIRSILMASGSNANIQADGGIRHNVVPELYSAGADVITAGSLLFKNDYSEVKQWINSLKR